jgi:hypothetical protein
LISSPTTKKKITINASFTQYQSGCTMLQPPTPMESSWSQKACQLGKYALLAAPSAINVQTARTMPDSASMRRNC